MRGPQMVKRSPKRTNNLHGAPYIGTPYRVLLHSSMYWNTLPYQQYS